MTPFEQHVDEYAPAQTEQATVPAAPRCHQCRGPLEPDGCCWRCDLGCPHCQSPLDEDGFCRVCGAITPKRLHPMLVREAA